MTDYQKILFAVVSIAAVCGIIIVLHADPYVPPVGTDMACPALVGSTPDVIGMTGVGLPISCFAAPVSAAAYGSPTSRTLALATAYQATTNTKPASVNINLTSTADISLSGGTTNSATVYIGSTTGVASGTGTPICIYSNSNTGALTIGLNLNTIAAIPCHFDLPVGWYWAIVQSAGTVTITSAFDQSVG